MKPQQPKAAPTNNQTTDQAINELHEWLKGSFRAFLADDPTRTTGTSAEMAADYAIIRFETLLANEMRKAETRARIEVAINAMAIALYWLEEDGRPKHLWQDLWDVMDISVLDHIDKKYKEEAKGHFADKIKGATPNE